jgi:hypothetical protein
MTMKVIQFIVKTLTTLEIMSDKYKLASKHALHIPLFCMMKVLYLRELCLLNCGNIKVLRSYGPINQDERLMQRMTSHISEPLIGYTA